MEHQTDPYNEYKDWIYIPNDTILRYIRTCPLCGYKLTILQTGSELSEKVLTTIINQAHIDAELDGYYTFLLEFDIQVNVEIDNKPCKKTY